MAKTLEEKKYRILESFVYKGKDGKGDNPITLAPGEDVPELDDNERERLLDANSICEIAADGENKLRRVQDKERIELDEAQLNYLMPNARTLKFLKQNRLTRKALIALREKIAEGIAKFNVQPNYYIEEIEKMISTQLLYIE